MAENNMVRQHMKITGRVQGVGFRYRARYAAVNLGVTGWVKNEWDGSVELEAQGTVEQIHQMLKTINQSPYIRIEWIDREEMPVNLHDTGFHIR
mgnify:CR=1 FL=1